MATGQGRRLAWPLDGLLIGGTAAGLTDGQLLERFATATGPAADLAFSAIVERHGPMVLRVCLGVAGNRHDAEDAFQATFLVLVKKSRSLWVADSLGPWLHQVALRTSQGARVAASRRRRHEEAVAERTEAADAPVEGRDDVVRILHEEIGRLPDHYRVPVVLCDLEGQTQEQAARSAGLPLGTVKSRLNRAREKLRSQLIRRGVSPAGAVIPAIRLDLDAQVPDALVRSTTAAAARLAATHSLAGTTAGLLAQGVLSTMARSIWWKAGTILLAAATVSGAGLVAGQGSSREPTTQPGAGTDVKTVGVERGSFRVLVSGNGSLETDQLDKVVAEIDSNTAIVSSIPEGARVKKGDLVIELDSSAARKLLANQQRSTQAAGTRLEVARLAREAAEFAIKEYEEGIYAGDRSTLLGEIKLAEADLVNVEARRERTKQARNTLKAIQGPKDRAANPDQIVGALDMEDRIDRAERDALSAKLKLEAARARLNRLENYTKVATLKGLRLKVAEARVAEISRQSEYDLEKNHESHAEAQVQACRIVSPRDGFITHFWNGNGAPSRELTVVTPRQPLFTVFDVSGPMDVAAKLGEPMIHRVTEGQRVDVRVHAYPEKRFTGIVTSVAPRPDVRKGVPVSKPVVYTTMVRLDHPDTSLRPGMNASVDVLVAEHDNTLTVPAKAVIGRVAPYRVAVKRPDGRVEIREVTFGDGDESRVEVKSGLQAGEMVVLQPESLLGDSKTPDGGRSTPK
ncbi:sigma-70 family RNA polymerase sigma factor [Aquisphaera insulae]|uniref:sigma-70 family RNA polymerase sigma factor n=1 Tax=Aquisphaera insulae TaxID=2712864 RepID=UPI0013ED713C|nr:sigma-70 family RNA polymerase sigma factor [Aquisphaera insulae]